MAGVRERARQELLAEILRLARQQLADGGASSLSLRQIARDLDMVSSAIYRYYPSRDDLLTALIIDAYNEMGAAAEQADASAVERGKNPRQRWLAVTEAMRAWAAKNPADYALIFGSPVPGYRAPDDTIAPATRLPRVLVGLLQTEHVEHAMSIAGPSIPRSIRANLKTIAADSGVPETVLLRGLTCWVQAMGLISFELFGHLHNVIDDKGVFFSLQMEQMADFVGFR
jgi:AcrR family transcriptional regulator